MSNIMIVEDDLAISKGLENIILEIDSDINIEVTAYAGEAFLLSQKINIDAFFLDIQLKDYSGLELAKKIRNIHNYKFTPIVFITAIPTREMIAFKEIHCYDYIIKPFDKKRVRDVFETIINHGINRDEEVILKLTQKTHTYILKQDDILYLESELKKIKIATINETLKISRHTLKGLHKELTKDFIRCHRGFIVNIKHIKQVDLSRNLIFLNNLNSNDVPIPLGRNYKNNLKDKLRCN